MFKPGSKSKYNKKILKKIFRRSKKNDKNFFKGKNDFYDDYAHHPTEIRSILDGVKNVNANRNIISVFEPHRYSRVLSLQKEFAQSFRKSNLVLLCPIYSAGEKKNSKFDNIKFGNLISKLSKQR